MKKILYIFVPICTFVVLALTPAHVNRVQGSSFPGTAAFLQTAATSTVNPHTAVKIANANVDCKSRVVTTYAQINVSLGNKTTGLSSSTLTFNNGHFQGASTTVAYDSGIYGCGEWWAIAPATTTITISEF